jgi:hypothetical protein
MARRPLKAIALCTGGDCKESGLQESDDGTVREVDYEITGDDKLVFSLPDISGIKGRKFSLGPASTIVGLVVKFGQEMPEIQAIHASSDAAPMMCCQCGRVKVCGSWCSCLES